MDTQHKITVERKHLRIDGRPALVQAGALHYFALPHAALWEPVLQRMRMAGLNAVLVPVPWAYHSPAPGLYDFTGPRDLARLFDAAERCGLWLIVHAGPWLRVGLNAGGLPAWFVHQPDVRPDCAGTVPGPSFTFLRHLREWWERLFPLFGQRPNLLGLALDPGSCADGSELHRYVAPLVSLARELGVEVPLALATFPPSQNPDAPVEQVPLWSLSHEDLEQVQLDDLFGLIELRSGPELPWGGESREQLLDALGDEHPRPLMHYAVGHGAGWYALAPAHAGAAWGYWGTSEFSTAHGVGAPVLEGAALPAAYYQARQAALALETLGGTLTTARPAQALYASDPRCLQATRAGAVTTVAFLGASADEQGGETRLSLALGDEMMTTEPVWLPPDSARVLPLHWPVAGGHLLNSTLEVLLRITVAGRHLLVVSNKTGGDMLLSEDFRPRHARGPVRTQRTEEGLAVRFEAAKLASLLLDSFDEPLQILALAPALATRVWPLDDGWRVTPTYPAAWNPTPEDPARGLLIGPDFALPRADGGYDYLVSAKGFGYRWGPWRGSDPKTWLAPITWRAPRSIALPELAWASRAGAPEVLPGFDDRTWQSTALGAAGVGGQAHGGFVWYRGHFEGDAREATLLCPHAGDVFLNGAHIAALNAPLGQARPTPKTLPLPQRYLRAENELVVLVELLGSQHHWDTLLEGQGLLSCALDSGAPLHWRVRRGLSGERTVQGFPGYADWALVPDGGDSAITWHRSVFDLALPDEVEVPLFLYLERAPTRAYIYLNGQMIGRYWEGWAPEHRFWLPQGLLREQGPNELLMAQWTRGAQPGLGAAHLEAGEAMQWHAG